MRSRNMKRERDEGKGGKRMRSRNKKRERDGEKGRV